MAEIKASKNKKRSARTRKSLESQLQVKRHYLVVSGERLSYKRIKKVTLKQSGVNDAAPAVAVISYSDSTPKRVLGREFTPIRRFTTGMLKNTQRKELLFELDRHRIAVAKIIKNAR